MLTKATRDKRLKKLEADIAEAIEVAARFRRRADEADRRAVRLEQEADWLRQAPVVQPLPEGVADDG